MMLSAINRMLPANETQGPEPSPTLRSSSTLVISLGPQQDSQWGISGIGTLVFGCIASILGILALWITFWTRQRESARAEVSEERAELRHVHTNATISNDDAALGDLSNGADAGPEAVERSRGDAAADTEA